MLKIFSHLITTKISPKWIVKNHLNSLVDGFGRKHFADYFTFFIIPLIPAVIAKGLGAKLDSDMVDIINTGLALFAGLFLSVSIQLISIDKSKIESHEAKRVQKQTIDNISFLIFVALITILMSYFSLFDGIESDHILLPYEWYKTGIDIIVYWLIGVFMLTVLMVLKRTAILFEEMNKN